MLMDNSGKSKEKKIEEAKAFHIRTTTSADGSVELVIHDNIRDGDIRKKDGRH